MTIDIEYEAADRLDIPYEEIIREIIPAVLDREQCPYEAEVHVLLTDRKSTRLNSSHRN